MPSINLIAGRRAEKRRQQQNVRKLVYAIAGEIGVVVLAISIMTVRLAQIGGHVGDLNSQIAKLEPKVNQIQQLEGETARMTPKVSTLDGAKADTLFWYNNLHAVTDSLPQKTWLTSLSTTGGTAAAPGAVSGSDPVMSVQGIAFDQTTVGETMLRMNNAPTLDHVDLAYVQQQETGRLKTVSFQMTVHLKPQPSALAQTARKGDSNAQKP